MFEQGLNCQCGKVQGRIELKQSSVGNRVVCHCKDCQKFANFLTESSSDTISILDKQGGTDLFQIPVAKLQITQGIDHLACIKLSAKGLHRWYTDCCKTPIGNTMGASMPFIGVIHSFMSDADNRDQQLGPVKEYCQSKDALSTVLSEPSHPAFSLGVTFTIMSKMLSWKLQGFSKPSVFFNANGEPVVPAKIINQ